MELFSRYLTIEADCIELFSRYLTVETGESHSEKDERIKEMYYTVFKRFSKALVKVGQKHMIS